MPSAQNGLLEGDRTLTESPKGDCKELGTEGKVIVSIQRVNYPSQRMDEKCPEGRGWEFLKDLRRDPREILSSCKQSAHPKSTNAEPLR